MTELQFKELILNQDLSTLNYPSSKDWMFNYCLYLGSFTDSNGKKYDLGVHLNNVNMSEFSKFSDATVYDDNPGSYSSGFLDMDNLVYYNGQYITKLEWYKIHNFEAVIECWNRLQNLLSTFKS